MVFRLGVGFDSLDEIDELPDFIARGESSGDFLDRLTRVTKTASRLRTLHAGA